MAASLHYGELRLFFLILKSEYSTVLRHFNTEAEFGERLGSGKTPTSSAAALNLQDRSSGQYAAVMIEQGRSVDCENLLA